MKFGTMISDLFINDSIAMTGAKGSNRPEFLILCSTVIFGSSTQWIFGWYIQYKNKLEDVFSISIANEVLIQCFQTKANLSVTFTRQWVSVRVIPAIITDEVICPME